MISVLSAIRKWFLALQLISGKKKVRQVFFSHIESKVESIGYKVFFVILRPVVVFSLSLFFFLSLMSGSFLIALFCVNLFSEHRMGGKLGECFFFSFGGRM